MKNQARPTQAPKPDTRPESAPSAAPQAIDQLGFYRVLASVPALSTFRAKVTAVVLVCTLLPAFLLVLAIVLGAGRISAITLILLVVLFTAAGAAGLLWALGRLLVPLDLATESIDDVALERPLARVDLPGSDVAAQILRGVQALVARIEALVDDAKQSRDRDELTGLWNRRAGRERGQALIDRETRRGRVVRALVADVNDFTAFNARRGTGHGDALLKAIGSRLARVAVDDGIAVRWHGDAFLLVQAAVPDEWSDADELLGRPIIVKGSEESLTLALGVAHAEQRISIDALVAEAEAALARARGENG
jgi:diguanylate cyclase (GGDEF)-like protein